jgi:hypothetical protein
MVSCRNSGKGSNKAPNHRPVHDQRIVRRRKPASPWLRADRERRSITTKRRYCQQHIEVMQQDVRFQRLLLTRAPQMATQIQRNLELLKIQIATALLKMRIMLRTIREKEKFQRGYLLLHPREGRFARKKSFREAICCCAPSKLASLLDKF